MVGNGWKEGDETHLIIHEEKSTGRKNCKVFGGDHKRMLDGKHSPSSGATKSTTSGDYSQFGMFVGSKDYVQVGSIPH
jgi:hypothetical protein